MTIETKKLSLVKYAGEFWVTLSDYTITRDPKGYSDHASVKSAVRTFVVKSNPDKYIAFRGELQLKNIINENKNNPLFQAEDFQGTRTALIHFSMLPELNHRFNGDPVYNDIWNTFIVKAHEVMENENVAATKEETTDVLSARSTVLRQLRQELNRLDKSLEVIQRNKEKLLQAINAIESLEIEEEM